MSDTAPRNSAVAADTHKAAVEEVDRAEDVHVDGEQSKFSAMLGILRKLIGVSDVIS
ncbi:hypothetical protein EC988_005638, partial [Linderina pennispora]